MMVGSVQSITGLPEYCGEKDNKESEPKLVSQGPLIPRIYLSSCLYGAFFCLGLCANVFGPSLVQMISLYDTDLTKMSIAYTFAGIGYLIGSFLCGLIFDRFNHEVQFIITLIMMGLSTASLPWLQNMYILYAMSAIQNIPMGFINACSQSYILKFWIGHRFKDPILQGSHCIWSVAATIAPLIVKIFIVDSFSGEQQNPNATTWNYTGEFISSSTPPSVIENITEAPRNMDDLNKLRYPYAIIGIFTCAMSLVFIFALFCGKNLSTSGSNTETVKHQEEGKTRCFKLTIFCLLFLYYHFFVWYEIIPGRLLSTFVVKGLDWHTQYGPTILSVYWGAHGVGRLIGVPLSILVKPILMYYGSAILCLLAFIMMTIWVNNDIVLWVSTGLAGLAMGPTFGTVVLLVSEYLYVSGLVASVILVGASVGAMTGTMLAGYLFDTFTHMWTLYLCLGACVLDICLLTIVYIVLRAHKRSQSKEKPELPEEAVAMKAKEV